MMTEPITVTALNQYVKGLMDRDRLLSQVLVRSEISNYKVYPSGHHYFSLKDAESSVRCVMFRREASSLWYPVECLCSHETEPTNSIARPCFRMG